MENGVDKTLQVQLQVAVQGEDVTIHIKWDDQTERARASFQYQDVQHLSGYIDEILDGEEDEGEDEHDDDFEPPEKARHYPSSPPLPPPPPPPRPSLAVYSTPGKGRKSAARR